MRKIKSGVRVEVIGVGKEDAYYPVRKPIIGKKGTVLRHDEVYKGSLHSCWIGWDKREGKIPTADYFYKVRLKLISCIAAALIFTVSAVGFTCESPPAPPAKGNPVSLSLGEIDSSPGDVPHSYPAAVQDKCDSVQESFGDDRCEGCDVVVGGHCVNRLGEGVFWIDGKFYEKKGN